MDRSSEHPVQGGLPRSAPGVLRASPASALERWAADAIVDEAARSRTRARWLRVQSEESASFVGTLLDLAERAEPVVVDAGGQQVLGPLVGIGGDFVVVRVPMAGRTAEVLIRIDAIDVVRAAPGAVEVHGDRAALLDVQLGAVLGPMAADRPTVVVRTTQGVSVRGELRTAGTDVVRVLVDGDPPAPAWIRLEAVATLTIT
jgi:hypothetical protein